MDKIVNYKEEAVIIQNGTHQLYGILTVPEDFPSSGTASFPLIIGCHGFDGTYKSKLDYAQYLARRGAAFYAFDFYGGGRETMSGGTMEEMSVLTEADDLLAVIRHFREDPRIDAGRIALWGHSQGGYVASYVAGTRPELVHSMILLYPAYVIRDHVRSIQEKEGSIPEYYEQWDCRLGKIYGEDVLSHDIYEVISHFSGNVLLVHGEQDEMVPISYSEKAIEVFPNVRRYWMAGAGHGFEGEDREKMKELAADFLKDINFM